MKFAKQTIIVTYESKKDSIYKDSLILVSNNQSNLENKLFTKDEWQEVIDYFDNKCAYCHDNSKLFMEHAIPINKKYLGEHRLGNIIPSCSKCNSAKHNKNFKEFLQNDIDKINKIKRYMKQYNYSPYWE